MHLCKRPRPFQLALYTACSTMSSAHEHAAEPCGLWHTAARSSRSFAATELPLCRYIAHFRSIHRGAFFAQMRTTAVRKLLPDSWGFLCPVHTPDGAPCGLLNHLAAACYVVTHPPRDTDNLRPAILQVSRLWLAFEN